jgi:hypothetical protein
MPYRVAKRRKVTKDRAVLESGQFLTGLPAGKKEDVSNLVKNVFF